MTSKRKNVPQSEFIFIIFIIYYFDISTFLRSLNYNFGKNKTEMLIFIKNLYNVYFFFSLIKNKNIQIKNQNSNI